MTQQRRYLLPVSHGRQGDGRVGLPPNQGQARLVTGAGGMLGLDVQRAAENAGHEAVALTRAQLDITDADATELTVRDVRPDAVINCAAWTNVDGAESHLDEAMAVNGVGAGNVATAAAAAGAWLVHVSTDYVFNGTKAGPYVESDPVDPVSA